MKTAHHLTPLNDEYQSCERTLAELRVYTDLLDPNLIGPRLGITPSRVQVRGQLISPSSERVAQRSAWFLSTEPHVDSKDLRRHLDWLMRHLSGARSALLDLQDSPGIQMTVNCIWWSRSGQGGPTLWPQQMQRLAELNLECALDFSFYGED